MRGLLGRISMSESFSSILKAVTSSSSSEIVRSSTLTASGRLEMVCMGLDKLVQVVSLFKWRKKVSGMVNRFRAKGRTVELG